MTRDEKTKKSFIDYLELHPQLRFWQAIYGFTRHPYIAIGGEPPRPGSGWQDTFNIEGDELYFNEPPYWKKEGAQ